MTQLGSMHLHGVASIIVRKHDGGKPWPFNTGRSWGSEDRSDALSYVEIIIADRAGNRSIITLFGDPAIELPDDIFDTELRRRGDEAALKINPPRIDNGIEAQSMQPAAPLTRSNKP